MQLLVGLPGAKECPCTHQEVVTSERSHAYPEYAIEEYLEQRITECVQNKLYVNSGHREPVSLEQNFFVSCLNSFKHNAIKVRRNQEEVGRINSSTRLPARVPVSGVSKVSRWQRKTGAKGRSARPRRRERSRRRSRMQPSAQEKEEKTVPPFTSCGGKKQWCPGRSEHIAQSYAWQNDMKASVNKAWQISPICRLLVEVRSCLTEPNAFTTKIKVGPCRRTQKPGHVARAFETQLSWLDTGTHQEPSRDHTEQCRTRIIQAMSSDVAFSAHECHVHSLMRSQT